MILLIDNFDSFTYNLVQSLELLGVEVLVIRNHAKTVKECLNLKPQAIIIGPGPGSPTHAGISLSLIHAATEITPILGVCLGHQAIAEAFGGKVIRAHYPMHGKISLISHQNKGIFYNIPQEFKATRYHSLIVEKNSLPPVLEVTASDTNTDEIMGIRHKTLPIEGIQYHPESITTEYGMEILKNFLSLSRNSATGKCGR